TVQSRRCQLVPDGWAGIPGAGGVLGSSQTIARARQKPLKYRGCSEPRSHHCTPAWATERDSTPSWKKKKKNYTTGARRQPEGFCAN
uniref:Uncharacterized protein n=1 Tax=Theropithecus gelada TaxID=9565 RepID=A0A8D2ECX8_THEGE